MVSERELAQIIAEACLAEKALDVVILEVADLTVIADYFVIASGRSYTQVANIIKNVEENLSDKGIKAARKDGYPQGTWTVLDYHSTILHVFQQEEREHYNLENLWGDAKEIKLNPVY